jgi:hypothetical protein
MPRISAASRGVSHPVPIKRRRIRPAVFSSITLDEGSNVTFNLFSYTIPNGTTLYWMTEGNVNANDFVDGVTSGTATVTGKSVSITRQIKEDINTEGQETFRLVISADSNFTRKLATTAFINVNDTSITPTGPQYVVTANTSSVNEGNSIQFDIVTNNVADGSTLYWTVEGNNVTASDFVENTLSGSVTINNDAASVVLNLASDNSLNEGTETFVFNVREDGIDGSIVASTNSVTINDTSNTTTWMTATGAASITARTNEPIKQFTTAGTYTLTIHETKTVTIRAWGAAGGFYGGVGGYSSATYTFPAGTTHYVVVGRGGLGRGGSGEASGAGGGGAFGRGGPSARIIGGGGGYTGLFRSSISQNNAVLIAGGGGGGTSTATIAGNGGGSSGLNGGSAGNGGGGGGGSQAAAGARGTSGAGGVSYNNTANSSAGSALQGGRGAVGTSTSYSAGGGGGGYFGGGGGAGNNPNGGAGGGGSGRLHPSYCTNGVTTATANSPAATLSPPNTGTPGYTGNYGKRITLANGGRNGGGLFAILL